MEKDTEEAPTKLDAFERREYDATSRHLRHRHHGVGEQHIQVEIDNRSESSFSTVPSVTEGLFIFNLVNKIIFLMIMKTFSSV